MEAEDPLEAISGTNGVTGAADAVLVLSRGAKGVTLYGRGRDIEEIETAMRFDAGRWSILGDADEVRKSDERRKIVFAAKKAGDEQTPAAIAKLTGMKVENVRVLIRKMVASGEVLQPRVGYCTAPAAFGAQSTLAFHSYPRLFWLLRLFYFENSRNNQSNRGSYWLVMSSTCCHRSFGEDQPGLMPAILILVPFQPSSGHPVSEVHLGIALGASIRTAGLPPSWSWSGFWSVEASPETHSTTYSFLATNRATASSLAI
jgi:hypothetical protein